MARLGWSYGDQEIFSFDELIKKFSLDSITTSAAVFNPEKLEWLNQHYIKTMPPEILAEHWRPILERQGLLDEKYETLVDTIINTPKPNEMILPPGKLTQRNITAVIPSLQERSKTLVEMAEKAEFYFKDDIVFDEKAKNKFLTTEVIFLFEQLIKKLDTFKSFEEKKYFKWPKVDTILTQTIEATFNQNLEGHFLPNSTGTTQGNRRFPTLQTYAINIRF